MQAQQLRAYRHAAIRIQVSSNALIGSHEGANEDCWPWHPILDITRDVLVSSC